MNRLVRSMSPQINQALAAAKEFEETFGAARAKFATWYEQQGHTLQPVLKQVAEQYAIVDKTRYGRAVLVLLRNGWFGVAPYLDSHELLKLADVHIGKGAEASNKFVCSLFSRNRHERLHRVTREWWGLSYMKRRRSIVMAALQTYEEGQYCLTIPALLPLVDGLARAYFCDNPGKPHRKSATVLVEDAARLLCEVHPDHADLLVTALISHIYSYYRFGTAKAPSTLNRHGILHGDIVRYDSEKNALRTILLLDVICRMALAGPKVP